MVVRKELPPAFTYAVRVVQVLLIEFFNVARVKSEGAHSGPEGFGWKNTQLPPRTHRKHGAEDNTKAPMRNGASAARVQDRPDPHAGEGDSRRCSGNAPDTDRRKRLKDSCMRQQSQREKVSLGEQPEKFRSGRQCPRASRRQEPGRRKDRGCSASGSVLGGRRSHGERSKSRRRP